MAEPLCSGRTRLAMALPRKLCAAAGGMAGLGSAVWLSVAGPLIGIWGGLTVASTLVVAAIALLAILVTTAGALLADWRASVESRRAWAEIDIGAVELGQGAGAATPSKIDPVYTQGAYNEALHRLLQAHRFAALRPARETPPETAAAPGGAQADGTVRVPAVAQAAASLQSRVSSAERSVAATSSCARQKDAATAAQTSSIVAFRPRQSLPLHAKPAACPLRLAANAWPVWPTPAEGTIAHDAFDRPNIVVLCGGHGDRARLHPEGTASASIAGRDEPPSCRGPPPVPALRVRATMPAKLSLVESALPAAGVLPTADPVVRDNFGPEVPVRAAELDAIETYLDHVLRDVLASSTAHRREERA